MQTQITPKREQIAFRILLLVGGMIVIVFGLQSISKAFAIYHQSRLNISNGITAGETRTGPSSGAVSDETQSTYFIGPSAVVLGNYSYLPDRAEVDRDYRHLKLGLLGITEPQQLAARTISQLPVKPDYTELSAPKKDGFRLSCNFYFVDHSPSGRSPALYFLNVISVLYPEKPSLLSQISLSDWYYVNNPRPDLPVYLGTFNLVAKPEKLETILGVPTEAKDIKTPQGAVIKVYIWKVAFGEAPRRIAVCIEEQWVDHAFIKAVNTDANPCWHGYFLPNNIKAQVWYESGWFSGK
jgi:hypothetical protein